MAYSLFYLIGRYNILFFSVFMILRLISGFRYYQPDPPFISFPASFHLIILAMHISVGFAKWCYVMSNIYFSFISSMLL